MKKFFLFFVCCVCLPVLLMVNCSSPRDSHSVKIWHWITDRHKAFEQLAARYKSETGVDVSFELYAPSTYARKITAAAQAGILPDIYGVLDKKYVLAKYIKNGFVADLTAEFQADDGRWEHQLLPKALALDQFHEGNVDGVPPGIYGVPIDITNIQMLYNKKLLAKAGIKTPPKTFSDFLQDIAALKRVGIPGLVSGWGEVWMVDCFASIYALNIMGLDKLMATYRGEVPYTDPDWIRVLGVFEQLRDSGALVEGMVTKANKYAEQDFALERAAFAFNGSWCVNVYREMNPDLEYGTMLPPVMNEERPMWIWGGAGSSFVVNKNSPNRDKAIAFLKWLTAREQQVWLSEATRNLPANREALREVDDDLAGFATAMDKTTHPSIWPYYENAVVSEAFDKGIQAIIIGTKTARQVAEEVQSIKEREMKKALKRKKKQDEASGKG